MGTAMEKYLYFRTVADEDDDDAITADSALVPVSKITGFYPSNSGSAGTAADELTIYFESINNVFTSGDNEEITSDSVLLNITAGQSLNVMQAIVDAINATGVGYQDGYIVVADDATTTVGASSIEGNNATKAAVVIHSGITSCGAITILPANS